MKFMALLAGFFVAAMSSLPAHAQPAGRDFPRRFERPQQQRDFQRQREFRREEEMQRRQQDRMAGEEGRQGRLTPEERQQLRRDIREHGRDVYRDRPRNF